MVEEEKNQKTDNSKVNEYGTTTIRALDGEGPIK